MNEAPYLTHVDRQRLGLSPVLAPRGFGGVDYGSPELLGTPDYEDVSPTGERTLGEWSRGLSSDEVDRVVQADGAVPFVQNSRGVFVPRGSSTDDTRSKWLPWLLLGLAAWAATQ